MKTAPKSALRDQNRLFSHFDPYLSGYFEASDLDE